MTLSDQELTLFALREAQLILADHVQPGARDGEKTIQQLLEVLDRNDVVEAMDRLETETGTRLA
jgi:urease gamma subunit